MAGKRLISMLLVNAKLGNLAPAYQPPLRKRWQGAYVSSVFDLKASARAEAHNFHRIRMLIRARWLDVYRGTTLMPNLLLPRVNALLGTTATARDKVKWLYEALSILDAKANGLLRINSLVMTILSLIFTYARTAPQSQNVSPCFLTGCLFAFVALGGSSVLCFLVVRMSWDFLGSVLTGAAAPDFTAEIDGLVDETTKRTHFFVWAWRLGLVGYSIAMFLALLAGVILVGGLR